MESNGFLTSPDDRSYGTSSTSLSLSPSPLTMRPIGSSTFTLGGSSSLSLSSLMLPPNPLLNQQHQQQQHDYSSNQERNHLNNGYEHQRSGSFMSSPSLSSIRSVPRRIQHDDSGSTSSSSNSPERKVDACRLYDAAKSAGLHAFGIVAVDVWLLDHGRFVHSEGGLWISPIFQKRHPSHALDRIMSPSHPDHVPPIPQVPGAGLAGYFWALGVDKSYKNLIWRDLHAITSDPFQPPYKRMRVLEEAGFGKATGVPFDVMGHKGVVIYMARETASETLLNESTNVEYLKFAAQHIGTASALSQPRQACEQTREERVAKTYRRVVKKMDCVQAFVSLRRSVSSTRSLRSLTSVQSSTNFRSSMRRAKSFHALQGMVGEVGEKMETMRQRFTKWTLSAGSRVKDRIAASMEKAQGSKLSPPPPAPLVNVIWTFVGCFLTLLAMFGLAIMLRYETGDTMVLAPFGALLTLQFSLTAAPASQPRNIIYGQAVSIGLALMSKHYLLDLYGWPHWLVVPMTTAVGISLMSKLGVTHPPAAAAIVALFSQPDFSVETGAFLLGGNVVAICIAILVNNLSEKRQYPVYWQFGVLSSLQSMGKQLCNFVPDWGDCCWGADDNYDFGESYDFQEYIAVQSKLLPKGEMRSKDRSSKPPKDRKPSKDPDSPIQIYV